MFVTDPFLTPRSGPRNLDKGVSFGSRNGTEMAGTPLATGFDKRGEVVSPRAFVEVR